MNASQKLRIILPGHCQLQCLACHNEHNADLFRFDWPNLKKAILSSCADRSVSHVNISGGEPLYSPNIEGTATIVDFIKSISPKTSISLNTNGIGVTSSIAAWLKQNVDYVKVSLYGGSDSEYEQYTGVACWKSVMDNLAVLKQWGVPVALNILSTRSAIVERNLMNYLILGNSLACKIKFVELIRHEWFTERSVVAHNTLYVPPDRIRLSLQRIGARLESCLIDREVLYYHGVRIENYRYPCATAQFRTHERGGWGSFLRADGASCCVGSAAEGSKVLVGIKSPAHLGVDLYC
jgi:molybdenum cofactor biosynthesis enzyme MoaA